MKVAWVTGGRGFLGRYVARGLAAEGWQVAGIGHGTWDDTDAMLWGVSLWREADVTKRSFLRLLAETGQPQLVFHAAGTGSVADSLSRPLDAYHRAVTSTAEALDALRESANEAVFIFPSSAAVYGVQPEGPISEDTPLAPVSPYGSHKMMAEELCRSAARNFGLRCAVIRFFSLFGPHLRKQLLWDVAAKLAAAPREVTLFGTGDETRDMLHVEDAARWISSLAGYVDTDVLIVNGGSGTATRVRDIVGHLADQMEASTEIRFSGRSRPGDPMFYQADTARSTAHGLRPSRSIIDGIAEYVSWFNQSGRALIR